MSHRFIPGIASQSLGNPEHHNIKDKLQAAAAAGLRSVEVFFEDIERLAVAHQHYSDVLEPRFQPTSNNPNFRAFSKEQQVRLACARQIQQWCLEAYPGAPSLDIICLQPFMHFEGLLDYSEREQRFQKLSFWIEVAKQLGTDLIQIPSNFLPESKTTGSKLRLVQDLREAAEIGAAQTPVIRFAHEAISWGTHTNTWDAAWELVEEVDMPNFGTCLDTFNIAGRVYADPLSQDGRNQNAQEDTRRSIQKLRDTFSDPEKLKKIFYVELCDGEILDAPLDANHEWYNAEQPARMTWSRNARLYPFETDATEAAAQGRNPGYLPVTEIFDALLDVGYEGYLSFEVFNRSLNQPSHSVIEEHAARAEKSWQRCAAYIDQHFQAAQSEAAAEVETVQITEMSYTSTGIPGGVPSYVGITPRL